MGVKEAYESSSKDTKDDFDHIAHSTADRLSEMGIDWGNEDGQILFRQLFAQEFGNVPQVIPAKESKGSIEQTIRNKDTDYMIVNLSNRTETIARPNEDSPIKAVNYTTTKKSSIATIDHFYNYRDNSSPGTRTRKIVSIRQFWRYHKRTGVLSNNVAEEMETPK